MNKEILGLKNHTLLLMHFMGSVIPDNNNTIAVLTTINSHQKDEDFKLQTIIFSILILQVTTKDRNYHLKGTTIMFLDHHHLANAE